MNIDSAGVLAAHILAGERCFDAGGLGVVVQLDGRGSARAAAAAGAADRQNDCSAAWIRQSVGAAATKPVASGRIFRSAVVSRSDRLCSAAPWVTERNGSELRHCSKTRNWPASASRTAAPTAIPTMAPRGRPPFDLLPPSAMGAGAPAAAGEDTVAAAGLMKLMDMVSTPKPAQHEQLVSNASLHSSPEHPPLLRQSPRQPPGSKPGPLRSSQGTFTKLESRKVCCRACRQDTVSGAFTPATCKHADTRQHAHHFAPAEVSCLGYESLLTAVLSVRSTAAHSAADFVATVMPTSTLSAAAAARSILREA